MMKPSSRDEWSEHWYACDEQESPCLFSDNSVGRLPGDPARCPRHGSIIMPIGNRYDRKTRREVKKMWAEEDAHTPQIYDPR